MRVVSTAVHGVVDYVFGAALLFVPFLGRGPSGLDWAPAILGAGVIVWSALTNYEFGALRVLPMRWHLALDAVGGVALLASAARGSGGMPVTVALVGLGVFALVMASITRTEPVDPAGHDSAPPIPDEPPFSSTMPAAHGRSTSEGRPVAPDRIDTVEQQRRAIDAGALGDKIPMTDPAAVPLGADDEASMLHDEEGLAQARRAGR